MSKQSKEGAGEANRMTTNSLDSLEDRIQKPGYLLLLVAVLLLLIVGLVDLIDYVHETNPVIFGRYDFRYLVVMVGYALFTLAWASLLLKPNDDHLLIGALDYIQMRPWLAIGVLALMGLAIVAMLVAADLLEGLVSTLPALQVTVLAIALLFSAIILFYKFGDESRPQRWRKIVLAGLGIILAIELLLQVLASFGALPGNLSTTQSIDDYAAYSRVYHTEEGLGSGLANNYGRYVPDFKLSPDSYRIAILGDSFIEAIQIQKEQNLGVLIENRLNTEGAREQISEVLSLGHPDLGPGIYLSSWLLSVMMSQLEPDEAIVFFDLGNDFQTVDRAGTGYPYFVYKGEGKAEMDETYLWVDVHKAEHHVFRGYKGFQPALFLISSFLMPRLIWENATEFLGGNNESGTEDVGPSDYEIDLPSGFVFSETTNENAIQIASAQINMANEELANAGVEVKLVTNPVFTEGFYEQDAWNTVFGDSDLLLPERRLREAAARYGMPFLGLGTYMAASEMTPAAVQELYYDNGLGHFTPEGHEFAAEAVYKCFFAQVLTPEQGCDLP
jgi:hypothetical protein